MFTVIWTHDDKEYILECFVTREEAQRCYNSERATKTEVSSSAIFSPAEKLLEGKFTDDDSYDKMFANVTQFAAHKRKTGPKPTCKFYMYIS